MTGNTKAAPLALFFFYHHYFLPSIVEGAGGQGFLKTSSESLRFFGQQAPNKELNTPLWRTRSSSSLSVDDDNYYDDL